VVSGCTNNNRTDIMEIITKLIRAGAIVDTEDSNLNKTALMIACEKGYIELVDHLLDNKAKAKYVGHRNKTPLHYVMYSTAENVDVANLLIKKGNADVNALTVDGWSPLLLAAQKKYAHIV
jgi:ankyrin repeat protein